MLKLVFRELPGESESTKFAVEPLLLLRGTFGSGAFDGVLLPLFNSWSAEAVLLTNGAFGWSTCVMVILMYSSSSLGRSVGSIGTVAGAFSWF